MDRTIGIEAIVKAFTYAIGGIGFLSVARHVPVLFAAGFIFLFGISALLEYRKTHFVPRRALTAIAVVFVVFSITRMSMENFVLPSVEALAVLLLIKLFGVKEFRDYLQVYVLSVFLLAGAALLSLDIVFVLYFSVLALLSPVALVMLTYYVQDRRLALQADRVVSIISKSFLLPVAALPMTALLFIALPRTSYPLFDFLNRGDANAATGFTDHVRLGAVSRIQEDSAIIFRAAMKRISGDQLYWRGIVLDYFDGTSWKRAEGAPGGTTVYPPVQSSALADKMIEQTIYLEPYDNRYLFALDTPRWVLLQRVLGTPDLTFFQSGTITRRTKYHVWSRPGEGVPERAIDRARYLQLPRSGTEGVEGLIRRLSVKNDQAATVRAIRSFLKGGAYHYALHHLPVTSHPLEDFLFRYRYGNCEYFASAMAIMLRMAGIPSRLVGGYRGGYYNEVGGYYLIPQKNAHVWVEAYIDNKGWVREDPTPPDSSGSGRNFFFKARLLFDSFSYAWNASVVNYDVEGQVALFSGFQARLQRGIHMRRLRFAFLLYAILITGVFYGIVVFARRRQSASSRVLRLFLKKMSKQGYAKLKSEGLEEFVKRIDDPDTREKACSFVKEFERHYFRDEAMTQAVLKRLRQLVKAL